MGPLVVLAAVVNRRADRKLLTIVIATFAFGNLVVLSNDVGGHGHKIFNLWEVLVNPSPRTGSLGVRTLWNGLPVVRLPLYFPTCPPEHSLRVWVKGRMR